MIIIMFFECISNFSMHIANSVWAIDPFLLPVRLSDNDCQFRYIYETRGGLSANVKKQFYGAEFDFCGIKHVEVRATLKITLTSTKMTEKSHRLCVFVYTNAMIVESPLPRLQPLESFSPSACAAFAALLIMTRNSEFDSLLLLRMLFLEEVKSE